MKEQKLVKELYRKALEDFNDIKVLVCNLKDEEITKELIDAVTIELDKAVKKVNKLNYKMEAKENFLAMAEVRYIYNNSVDWFIYKTIHRCLCMEILHRLGSVDASGLFDEEYAPMEGEEDKFNKFHELAFYKSGYSVEKLNVEDVVVGEDEEGGLIYVTFEERLMEMADTLINYEENFLYSKGQETVNMPLESFFANLEEGVLGAKHKFDEAKEDMIEYIKETVAAYKDSDYEEFDFSILYILPELRLLRLATNYLYTQPFKSRIYVNKNNLMVTKMEFLG